MSLFSVSADAIRKSYLDDYAKNALLGPGLSFGLPLSSGKTFKVSELEDGPVTLVTAREGRMIIPISAIAVSSSKLEADIAANIGWLAPPDTVDEHNEPWLGGTPTLWFGGEEKGSIVMLPNLTAAASTRLWPECLAGRALSLALPAPTRNASKRKGKRGAEATEGDEPHAEAAEAEAPDPEISLVVFYTVL